VPFTLSLDGPLLRASLTGVLTARGLEAFEVAVVAVENSSPCMPDRIIDLSSLEGISIGFDELSALARARLAGIERPYRSALVATTAMQVGYARMYQTLLDHPLITLRIFPSTDAALAWLAVT
jgi:hypothetical protein